VTEYRAVEQASKNDSLGDEVESGQTHVSGRFWQPCARLSGESRPCKRVERFLLLFFLDERVHGPQGGVSSLRLGLQGPICCEIRLAQCLSTPSYFALAMYSVIGGQAAVLAQGSILSLSFIPAHPLSEGEHQALVIE
jgi:hypothetical protein